jgi:hypothetical protein
VISEMTIAYGKINIIPITDAYGAIFSWKMGL